MKKIIVSVVLLLCAAMMFAGGQKDQAAGKGIIVGASNGWVGSEWRTQMVDQLLKVAEEYKAEGIIKDVIVQSTDVSIEGQIDQIRNLISKGCKIIIVNPNDAKAFNPVISEAKKKGVIVIGTDTELSSPDAINVCINQKEWAMTSAKWLAEKIGGKGNVVAINGVASHPANIARVSGYREVFSKYPNIKILNETNADWDSAKGMAAMQNLLASYPDINGVWVQDGMAEGALMALTNSGKKGIFIVGEARVGYMNTWKAQGADTVGVANPPGCMASALRVAVELAQGKTLKDGVLAGPYGNTIYVPIPVVVTNENFDKVYAEYKDKPAYFAVDGYISRQDAQAYFK